MLERTDEYEARRLHALHAIECEEADRRMYLIGYLFIAFLLGLAFALHMAGVA